MEKIIAIALFGLVWGSFLNVVIYRLPYDMSLIKPPSTCPECGKRIKYRDNIPVFSYLALGGKCRYCSAKIPITYLLVEILTPVCFLLVYYKFGWGLHFFASCVFTSCLIVLAVIDYYHQILPDEITLTGLMLALVYSLFREDLNLRSALIGALVGACFLLLVYGGYYLLRKKEGLGMGDVTMMLMVGAYLGWLESLFTLMLASFAGAIIGIILIFVQKKDSQYALPYGTFLAPAAFITMLWGNSIIHSYLRLFMDI